MMTEPISNNLELMEIGLLLPESLNNIKAWLAFLKTIHITDAQLLFNDNPDPEMNAHRSGNAAGNLLWLFQSLRKTVTLTRELVKVSRHLKHLTNDRMPPRSTLSS
jgi:hypothetical protein